MTHQPTSQTTPDQPDLKDGGERLHPEFVFNDASLTWSAKADLLLDLALAAEAEVARLRETVPEWLSDVERLARNIYYTTGEDCLRFGRLDAAAQDRYREMARKIVKYLPALDPHESATEAPRTVPPAYRVTGDGRLAELPSRPSEAPRTRDGEQGGERCDGSCHERTEDCIRCGSLSWGLICDSCRSYATEDATEVPS